MEGLEDRGDDAAGLLPADPVGDGGGLGVDVGEAFALHQFGSPDDGAGEGFGAGDALADVVAEIGEVGVAVGVGERGGDELVGGGFVLCGEGALGVGSGSEC